jgi:G2/mitotic-specific cyclin 3/4
MPCLTMDELSDTAYAISARVSLPVYFVLGSFVTVIIKLIDQQWNPQALNRQRDENAVALDVAPLKTLHQRNKSMSALTSSSLLTKGLNANPIRRTAFADISNKGKPTNVQDDLNVKPKLAQLDVKLIKPVQRDPLGAITNQQQENATAVKPKSLLRPTQRPLTAATQKAPLAEPVNSNVVVSSTHLQESSLDIPQPRKTITKRHTTIFRETSSSIPSNPLILSDLKSFSSTAPLPSLSGPASSLEPHLTLAPTTAFSFSIPAAETTQKPLPSVSSTTSSTEAEPVAAAPQAAHPMLVFEPYGDPTPTVVSQPIIEPELYLPALENQLPEITSHVSYEDPVAKQHVDIVTLKQNVVDIEEYWDEEEEEFFDAQGCITTRSFRSAGGDNTTGGVSIVLNPRANARVERELQAAKIWVEDNITPEDVEEEAWDTTMVVEYGDEIFVYMRDLEVCLIHVAVRHVH